MAETKTSAAKTKSYDGFTEEEHAAMKERAAELKKSARAGTAAEKAAAAAQEVVDKIAEMEESDRVIAERIHALVLEHAPQLAPRLWYGSPAYALDGKVLCFFQESTKFKLRYSTLGFNDVAKIDDGTMWPTSFAITALTEADEARFIDLITRAVS